MTTPYKRLLGVALALMPLGIYAPMAHAATTSLLRLGSQGTAVAVLQQELQDLGYHPGGITGHYTWKTRTAVVDFQRTHDLATDGITGPLTEGGLMRALKRTFRPVSSARVLRFSDYGPPVKALQRELAQKGDYHGAADGVYNDFTVAAVRTLERQERITVDGIAGPEVFHALSQGNKTSSVSTGKVGTVGGRSPKTTSPAKKPMVLGYYVPGQAAWSDLVAHASHITAVAPLWYSIRINGSLNNFGPNEAVVTNWSHAHHIGVYPLVINGYGNDNMLKNPTSMRTNVARLVEVAKANNYDGFNIDFESLNNVDEAGLDTFVADLAAGLHQEGKKLIVSVGPRTSNANGYHVYNYQRLGALADYVDLMTYDDHDNTGSIGPVAPMGWVSNIVKYADETIPSSKILVGLAGYGYNWASTGSTELNDMTAEKLASRYGSHWVGGSIDESQVTYRVNGVQHTVWFEDSASETMKVNLATKDHLGGVALWDLGEENAGVWPMLGNDLH